VRRDGGGRVRVAMGGAGEVVDGGADEEEESDEEGLLYADEDEEDEGVVELQGVQRSPPPLLKWYSQRSLRAPSQLSQLSQKAPF
jgi:hypothetical protein